LAKHTEAIVRELLRELKHRRRASLACVCIQALRRSAKVSSVKSEQGSLHRDQPRWAADSKRAGLSWCGHRHDAPRQRPHSGTRCTLCAPWREALRREEREKCSCRDVAPLPRGAPFLRRNAGAGEHPVPGGCAERTAEARAAPRGRGRVRSEGATECGNSPGWRSRRAARHT